MSDKPYVGRPPKYENHDQIVNELINLVDPYRLQPVKPILYLGDRQYFTLRDIHPEDPHALVDDKFLGHPIIRVFKENWVFLAG